jgi:hypothetical protein
MKTRWPATCALASLLAACGSPPAFRDRDPGVIQLQVVNLSPEMDTSVNAYADDYDCFVFQSVPGKWPPPAHFDTIETSLHRRPYQTVTMSYARFVASSTAPGLGVATCNGTYTFRADESVRYRMIGDHGRGGCRFGVERQIEGSGEWVKVEVVQREWHRPPLDHNGPWCAADARFRGSSRLETPRGP